MSRVRGVVLLALMLAAALLLPGGEPRGEAPALGMLSLYYTAHSFLSEGLYPTLLNFPEGGWWWPSAMPEVLIFAPITWILGPAWAWNLLWLGRVGLGAWGAGRWLEGRGVRAEWALLWVFWPGSWGLLEAGALEAGGILYLPLLLWLLEGPGLLRKGAAGLLRKGAAGLLLGSSPGLLFGGLVSLGILDPKALRDRRLLPVAVVAGILYVGRLWTLLAGDSLRPSVGAALLGGVQGDPGAASLEGVFWGWGSPLLLALILGIVDRPQRRVALWGAAGLLLALGPLLHWRGELVMLAQRPLPSPLLLLRGLPPLSVAEHLSGFSALAALAAILLLAPRRRAEWLLPLLLPLQLFLCLPSRTTMATSDEKGPIFFLPLPRDPSAGLAMAAQGVPVSVGPETLAPSPIRELLGQNSFQLAQLQKLLVEAGYQTVLTDKNATWGQGPELGWLLGERAEVGGAPWPNVDLQKQTLKEWSTVPVLPPEATAPRSSDPTTIDSGLEGLFDRKLGEQAMTEVWLYGSPDGQGWRPLRWIAHSLTSLGLSETPEGGLLLTGMVSLPKELGPKFPPFHSSSVVTLTSQDLEQWGARRWWLADRLALVDSHIAYEAGKPVLYSWVRTGALGVDPVSLTGDHPVVRAELGDDGLFHAGAPVWSLPAFADPSPMGELLYGTEFILGQVPRVVIGRREAEQYRQVAQLVGVTVPFVWKQDGVYQLLAHGPGPGGRLSLVRAVSTDGLNWIRPKPEPGFADISACESPVATFFKGQYLLFCSRRLRDARSSEEAPPGSGG